jgi:hypothetical protein
VASKKKVLSFIPTLISPTIKEFKDGSAGEGEGEKMRRCVQKFIDVKAFEEFLVLKLFVVEEGLVPARVNVDFGSVVVDSLVEFLSEIFEKGFWAIIRGFE